MARFILEGLTKKQAEAMASYYEAKANKIVKFGWKIGDVRPLL